MKHDELEALLFAAEEDIKLGDFAIAEKPAREVIEYLAENKTSASEALHIRALLALSESLWRRGLAIDALPVAEQALALSEDATGPEIKELGAKALRSIGAVYTRFSEYPKALEYYEKALALAEKLGNKAGMAALTNDIGIVYSKLSENAKALEYYEKALALYEELGNKAEVARLIGNIGIVYCELSQYAKALEFHEKALALDEELGSKTAVAKDTGHIGLVYASLSKYAKALEYYEKALALDEQIGNKTGVAIHTHNIGIVYSKLSENAKALEYYEKALAIDEELGNKAGVARITGSIGCVYSDSELSEYAKALEYFEKSLKLSEGIGDRRVAGYALSNIGETLRKMGRLEEAMEYLKRSLHLRREEIESNEDVANTLISIGSLLSEENQFAEAIEKLEEGLVLAEKLGEKKNASEAHKELADVYAKQGENARELEHLKQHYALKEEIFSDDTRKRVEAFNFRVAIANKERDLTLARQEGELQRLKAEHSEQQLSNSTLHLLAQTELLSDLRSDLLQIARKIPPQEPAARELRERVKNLPCKSIDWEKFDAQFKAAHPDFVHKLIAAVPEISPMEIRISTLIRMNLKSEEIARLFCVTERAVEFHRLNIRKKMGLKTKDNLSLVLAKM